MPPAAGGVPGGRRVQRRNRVAERFPTLGLRLGDPRPHVRGKLREYVTLGRVGAWAVLRGAPLLDGDEPGQVLITVEPASRDDVTAVMTIACALTPREAEVCEQVLAGRSTADIARQLVLSAYTVQDHLKSIFTKVGVRSRAELVTRLRAGA
ncbi:helix-turn-helix transcriptional regulator [Parafrankia sp. EUN1f]|uniref:helix-turn-helix transcriptional regulator n=1 Tax=Parafrankia sp. EUN1f TaxID=102897 RepID=UPI0001C45A3E|nr:helix-turn-helix transcriptional regulator [Parafrankia sp. EUN1f]EFC83254.1 transcriptional regulator, LuxR family [Parafrankia sp. EUN1f]